MNLLLEKSSDWKERPMKNKDLISSLKGRDNKFYFK